VHQSRSRRFGRADPGRIPRRLHALAAEFPQLALVVFDCKQPATSREHGLELLTAIRTRLTFDTELTVILSIANRDDGRGAFFERIAGVLGPREGLMIDAEDDPVAVSTFFAGLGAAHRGYGDGISFANFRLGRRYRGSVETAWGLRAQTGEPDFVYVWTVNNHDDIREYLRIGVTASSPTTSPICARSPPAPSSARSCGWPRARTIHSSHRSSATA
jgi:hypothetical protein